ncbi:hypothetical protein SAMN05216246_1181, partial [Actinomyces denticolens]
MSFSTRGRRLPALVGLMAASSLVAPIAMAAGGTATAASPKAPTFTVSTATCHAPKNLVTVTDFDTAAAANYRIVVSVDGVGAAAVKSSTSKTVFTTGNGVFDVDAYLKERGFTGTAFDGKKATVKLYYFDKDGKYADQYEDKDTVVPGETKDKMVPLGSPVEVTYEDPATVCETTMPTTPKVSAALSGDHNDVSVSEATTEPQKNYRFVATLPDGTRKALPKAFSEKIADGKATVSAEEALKDAGGVEAYYGKPIPVQAYYFDAEKRYATTAYVDPAGVVDGQTKEQFIKLGEPQELTLTKPAETPKPDPEP